MKKLLLATKNFLADTLHDKYAIHFYLSLFVLYVGLWAVIYNFLPDVFYASWLWWAFFAGLLFAPIVIVLTPFVYRSFKRAQFFFNTKYTVLEVKIPKTIKKTPKAMATVLHELINKSRETTFIDVWLNGKVRPRWSFEIASIEGKIHFYFHIEKNLKDFVESVVYSQYPDVEIHEVEDYTSGIKFDPDLVPVIPVEYVKARPDPYPIKTYIDYGMESDLGKTELRVDPLASVFEYLSVLGPGEQLWIQFVVREHKPLSFGVWPFKVEFNWHKAAQKQIDAIYDSLVEEQSDGVVKKGKAQLTPAQEEEVKALARTLQSDGVDVGIRAIYLARKEAFAPEKRISPGLIKLWKGFTAPNLNSLAPTHGIIPFDYPWQDIGEYRQRKENERVLNAFRRRSFFFPPYQHRYSTYSFAELASMYHFPSEEVKAPGLVYIESKTSNVPPNLPI